MQSPEMLRHLQIIQGKPGERHMTENWTGMNVKLTDKQVIKIN